MKEIGKYEHKNRRKYKLQVHLIFATKYRRKILNGFLAEICKEAATAAASRIGCNVVAIEGDKDHIHMMVEYPPELSVARIVQEIKQLSTNEAWMYCFKFLNQIYPRRGRILWSDGYFCCSIGEASPETIKQYIQNQG